MTKNIPILACAIVGLVCGRATLQADELLFDAESGKVEGTWKAVEDSYASEGKCVEAGGEGALALPFSLKEKGKYFVCARKFGVGEPFVTAVDGKEIGNKNDWEKWNWFWFVCGATEELAPGEHVLRFTGGGQGGMIDRVLITRLPVSKLCDYLVAGENEADVVMSAMAYPVNAKQFGAQKGGTAYFRSFVRSPRKQTVRLTFPCHGAVSVFLNKKEVFSYGAYSDEPNRNMFRRTVELQEGENLILVKTAPEGPALLRFGMDDGNDRLPKGLECRAFRNGEALPIINWSYLGLAGEFKSSHPPEQNAEADSYTVKAGGGEEKVEWRQLPTSKEWWGEYGEVVKGYVSGKYPFPELKAYEKNRHNPLAPTDKDYGVARRTLYVDAEKGKDANSGAKDAPWQTLKKACAEAQAGDLILVARGKYEALVPEKSGQPGAYITFRGMDANPADKDVVEMEKTMEELEKELGVASSKVEQADRSIIPGVQLRDRDKGSYVRIVNFRIKGGSDGVAVMGKAHHIAVEDCEITQCGHMAANLHFGANIVFRRVNMHDNSYGVHMGVKGNSAARGVLFEDCNADRNTEDRSDGFMAEGFCSGIVFVRCRASGNKDGAWDVKCPHARWYDCVASKSGKGFKVWYPPFYFENCLSYANGSGWQLARETADLVNCTIANCGSAIDLLVNGSLVNCIVYKSGLPAGISNQIRCENNLAFECGKGDLGLGFKVVDPGFVDPAKNDYHLAKDSPAIDAGVKEGASDHDLDGKPRPAGKGIDVGVYESQ